MRQRANKEDEHLFLGGRSLVEEGEVEAEFGAFVLHEALAPLDRHRRHELLPHAWNAEERECQEASTEETDQQRRLLLEE